nr:CPBP family glutamic-type intramembrane protease [Mucilaginibacter sp. L294]
MLEKIYAIGSYPALKNDSTLQSKLILLLKLYGIILLLNFFSAPLFLLWEYIVTHLHYKSLAAQYKTSMHSFMIKYGYWKAVLYVSLIGPVIEEIIFRLPLSFKRKQIAVAFGFALALMAKAIPTLGTQNLLINILVRVVIFGVGYFALLNILRQNITPNKNAQKGFILASIIIFGLLHTFNYAPFQWGIIYIYPLYVIPQLFMGWFLTYVRFKNGFGWGIALHVLINGITMLIQSAYKIY